MTFVRAVAQLPESPAFTGKEMSRAWGFHPHGHVAGGERDSVALRLRIVAALRAALGGAIEFRLILTGSAEPTVTFVADHRSSERWASRVLLPAYDLHDWRPVPVPCLAIGATFEARRLRPWPSPLRSSQDALSLMDALTLAARTAPLPFTLQLSAQPGPVLAALPLTGGTGSAAPGPSRLPSPFRAATPGFPAPHGVLSADVSQGWRIRCRVTVSRNSSGASVRSLLRAMEGAFRGPTGNGVRFQRCTSFPISRSREFIVSELELATTLPGPDSVASLGTASIRPSEILPLGRTASGRIVGPEVEATQGRHLVVLGETGMGKSSLMVSIARWVGRSSGLILLDPLGETARQVRLEFSDAAPGRIRWISPVESPPTLNALDGTSADDPGAELRSERKLNDLVHALRRVRAGRYVDSSYWGPRLEEMLLRAIRAAGAIPGGTLVDAHNLLSTEGRTRQVVPPRAVEKVRELADRIRLRPEDADGARRLLFEVVRSPTLERMLCAREPTLKAGDLVEPGRIVLVSGEASVVGEATARYLLAVYLALVWSELLSRPGARKTFVLLDEVQWYAHESLAEMLRLARRRNVHVVMATQSLSALSEEVRESAWTNVADVVAFRGSPDEARILSRASPVLSPESILSLPRGEAAVLLGKGQAVEWVRSVRVPAQPGASGHSAEETQRLVRHSAEASAAPRREGDGGSSAAVEEVVRYVRERVARTPPGAGATVTTEELRRALDPTGRAVRVAGSVLGRAGAIVRTERGTSGSTWHLRSPFPESEVAQLRSSSKADAGGTEPS